MIRLLTVVLLLALPASAEAAAGDPDRSFGRNGTVTLKATDADAVGFAVKVVGGNRVLAGGAAAGQFVVLKLRSSGSLDSTFGTSGQVVPALPGTSLDGVKSIQTFRDGRIVAAGTLRLADGTTRFVALRLLPTGEIDPSFGAGLGYVLSGPDDAQLATMVMDRNGNVILGGESGGSPLIVRLLADGTIDPTFGNGGTLSRRVARAHRPRHRPARAHRRHAHLHRRRRPGDLHRRPRRPHRRAGPDLRRHRDRQPPDGPGQRARDRRRGAAGRPVGHDDRGRHRPDRRRHPARRGHPPQAGRHAGHQVRHQGHHAHLPRRPRDPHHRDGARPQQPHPARRHRPAAGLAGDPPARQRRPRQRRSATAASPTRCFGQPPGGDPVYTRFDAIDVAGSKAVLVGSAAGPGTLVRGFGGTTYTGRFALTVSRLQ